MWYQKSFLKTVLIAKTKSFFNMQNVKVYQSDTVDTNDFQIINFVTPAFEADEPDDDNNDNLFIF